MRTQNKWLLASLSLVLSGCFAFSGDLGDVGKSDSSSDKDSNTESESESDTDIDIDTDIDADIDVDTDTDADIDTDTDVDTDTDTDIDINIDTDTDTECRGDACLAADTDTGTDSECRGDACIASDTGTDTDTDSECRGDTCIAPTDDSEISTDSSDTDTDSDTDTCGTQTCVDLGWDCGQGKDACGNDVTCSDCDTGSWCDVHTCVACDDSDHCGDDCLVCSVETPVCTDGSCVCDDISCNEGSRCVDGACAPCIDNDACGTDCEACPSETPLCVGDAPLTAVCRCTADPTDSCGEYSKCVTGVCTSCGATDDACGSTCTDCTATATPICNTDMDGGTCVECTSNNHCRNGDASPFNSPLGVCAPDGNCTCWVGNETWECTTQSDCDSAGSGYYCARDVLSGSHDVCLRSCSEAIEVENGMECSKRVTTDNGDQLVWAPMTTCYAYSKFGVDCSTNAWLCSVDGSGGVVDGSCQAFNTELLCTYSCWDSDPHDEWCPDSSTGCGDTIPNIYCEK